MNNTIDFINAMIMSVLYSFRPSLPTNRLIPNSLRLGSFLTQSFAFVFFVLLVIAFKERPLRVTFSSEDVGTNAIEEPAVMADNNGTARELKQCIFQCAQGFNVQIIRWFIEQQHITACNQGMRQVQSTALAA